MNTLKKFIISSDYIFACSNYVHEASEDTLFLLDNIDFSRGEKCLEIGVGMGIGAVYATNYLKEYYGVDINSKAVECAINNCILNGINDANIIISDCFSNITIKNFDIIFSNPPQLPTPPNLERIDEIGLANNGGKDGRLIIDRIIEQSSEYLCHNGCLYLLHFDMCNIKESISKLKTLGFETNIIATKKVSCGKLSYERVNYIKSFYNGIIYENNKYYYIMHILCAQKIK